MLSPRPTVLLTGASGIVGRAVAAQLHARRVGLVRGNPYAPGVEEVLSCDLAAPYMGLREQRWLELAHELDAIVHCAALTQPGQPRERYAQVNVEGTRRVIELAHAAHASVHLISTAFVLAVQSPGLRAENVLGEYLRSKLESERVLAGSGVPHTIFRASHLAGAQRRGASARSQIVPALADFICRGAAPYFPSHAGNRLDIAPLQALSIPVARAAEGEDVQGTYYVSYGPEAMSVPSALAVLERHAHEHGRDIRWPRTLDPRLPLPPIERLPASSRPLLRLGIDLSEVTYRCGGVLPSSLPELRERFGVPQSSAVGTFTHSLGSAIPAREREPVTVG